MSTPQSQIEHLQAQLVELNCKYVETLRQLEALRIEHQALALDALSADGQALEAYAEVLDLRAKLAAIRQDPVEDQPWS